MLQSGKLWRRHANVDSPSSGSGPTITAGWHTLVRIWDGYVDGLPTNTVAITAAGSWLIYRWGWQFSGSRQLNQTSAPFFGAFGVASGDAMPSTGGLSLRQPALLAGSLPQRFGTTGSS